jgi:hypothetical protein
MNTGSDGPSSATSSSCSVTPAPSTLQGDVDSTRSLGLTTRRDGLGPGTRDGAARATLQLTFA